MKCDFSHWRTVSWPFFLYHTLSHHYPHFLSSLSLRLDSGASFRETSYDPLSSFLCFYNSQLISALFFMTFSHLLTFPVDIRCLVFKIFTWEEFAKNTNSLALCRDFWICRCGIGPVILMLVVHPTLENCLVSTQSSLKTETKSHL